MLKRQRWKRDSVQLNREKGECGVGVGSMDTGGERGVERGFLAWKSFLSPDRKGQSDNELKGRCKLSHTTTCVCMYVCSGWST